MADRWYSDRKVLNPQGRGGQGWRRPRGATLVTLGATLCSLCSARKATPSPSTTFTTGPVTTERTDPVTADTPASPASSLQPPRASSSSQPTALSSVLTRQAETVSCRPSPWLPGGCFPQDTQDPRMAPLMSPVQRRETAVCPGLPPPHLCLRGLTELLTPCEEPEQSSPAGLQEARLWSPSDLPPRPREAKGGMVGFSLECARREALGVSFLWLL